MIFIPLSYIQLTTSRTLPKYLPILNWEVQVKIHQSLLIGFGFKLLGVVGIGGFAQIIH